MFYLDMNHTYNAKFLEIYESKLLLIQLNISEVIYHILKTPHEVNQ